MLAVMFILHPFIHYIRFSPQIWFLSQTLWIFEHCNNLIDCTKLLHHLSSNKGRPEGCISKSVCAWLLDFSTTSKFRSLLGVRKTEILRKLWIYKECVLVCVRAGLTHQRTSITNLTWSRWENKFLCHAIKNDLFHVQTLPKHVLLGILNDASCSKWAHLINCPSLKTSCSPSRVQSRSVTFYQCKKKQKKINAPALVALL